MSQHNEFERFRFSVLANNTSGSVAIPLTLTPNPTVLTSVTIHSDKNDVVLLSATVGWLAIADGTGLTRLNVLFKIWRDAPVSGTLVFSTDDSSESGYDSRKNTSFTHVDKGSRSSRPVTYFLTAELPDTGSAANVIGPITLTATEIEKEEKEEKKKKKKKKEKKEKK